MRLFNGNQAWQGSVREAIAGLEEGDGSCLHIAYCSLGLGDKMLIRNSGQAIRSFLKNLDMQQMIRLSENFRQYTSLDWVISWEKINPAKYKNVFESETDYIYMLILGSFHPNGYYRERCVREMAGCPGTLPYLILRLNDWVELIRDTAEMAVCKKVADCEVHELFYSAQALYKVRVSGRRSSRTQAQVEKLMERRMEQEAAGITTEVVLGYEYGVRKSIYRFLLSRGILDMEMAEAFLDRERHSFCQALIISELLEHYPCSMEQIDRYLRHKSACVRRKALDYKYRLLEDSWPGLEYMLLDTCRGVRELAAFILERSSGFDVQGFYVSHLQDENPAVSIAGLGERGSRETAPLIRPFLTHPSNKAVRSAVTALGRLEGMDAADIFWEYLFDSRVSVSKASFRAAVDSGVWYGARPLYEALLGSDMPHLTRYVLYLLLRENSWDRLPYLILIWQRPGLEEYRDKILGGLWCRNMYAAVPPGQAALIRGALEREGRELPERLRQGILFDLKFVEKPVDKRSE